MTANAPERGRVLTPDVFVIRYPFVREMRSAHWLADKNGVPEIECWRPGIVVEQFGPEDVEMVAHGEGEMQLHMVSSHKPGRYPERVFYERCFVDPDGKTFGRPKLHIATREKFNRLCRGYGAPYRRTLTEGGEVMTDYYTKPAEAILGDKVICDRCGTTLADYADKCHAALDVRCPGFEAIEQAVNQSKASPQ